MWRPTTATAIIIKKSALCFQNPSFQAFPQSNNEQNKAGIHEHIIFGRAPKVAKTTEPF